MYQIKTDQFSGPLDLLLRLIEEQKLDISQVALAKVTDQYLSYLDNNPNLSALELADFLVVATKLLVIKSKILLPELADDEEDSAEALEAQLKMYQEYLAASKHILKLLEQQNFCFSREKPALNFEPVFSPPQKLIAAHLKDFFQEILQRLDYLVNLPEKVLAKAVSLGEMVSNIRGALGNLAKINFKEMLKTAKSKNDIVVCFMALLELIKSGEIAVSQKGIFDEIEVERVV